MKKIQLRLFDPSRNQNFWFHFCYIESSLWEKYKSTYNVLNLDSQVKDWLMEDFRFEAINMEDIYLAKDLIKRMYAEAYPDVFLPNDGDRQGWTRVWLTAKLKKLLEVE